MKANLEVNFDLRVMSLAHGSFHWTLKNAIVLAAHAKGPSQTLARNTCFTGLDMVAGNCAARVCSPFS